MMPKQKPGQSKQDYGTPPEVIEAIENRLHINFFGLDLAASLENSITCPEFYDIEKDALTSGLSWNCGSWSWCNPPYANIKPWVQKACEESGNGAHIAMLVPASTGANWWRDYVDGWSYVLFLNGRVTFVGCDAPYPKDLALVLYTPERFIGQEIWSWNDYVG